MTIAARVGVVVAFTLCAVSSTAEPTKVLSHDEIAIYEHLLNGYPGEFIVSPDLLAYPKADPELLWKSLGAYQPNIYTPIPLLRAHRAAFDDMQAKARLKQKIGQWNSKIRVGSPAQSELHRPDPITSFSFSPIGFDAERRVAIVIRAGQQGPLAGSGECIILSWNGNTWKVESTLNLWVS